MLSRLSRLRKSLVFNSTPSPALLARCLSNVQAQPEKLRARWNKGQPKFDVTAMKALLDHDNHQMRDDFRELLRHPLFVPRYNLTLDEERELALKRLKVRTSASVLEYLKG